MTDTLSRIRTLVVDDEPLARTVLRELLAAHADVEILGECANGFEAVKSTNELKPDLLLLDVQMPKLDGFDVLELIGADVAVVFVTAYDTFALRAFEVHAVDYLLKPFGAERLAEALDRARSRMRTREPPPVRGLVAEAHARRMPLGRILIKDRSDVHVIPVEKIDVVEAQDDYISVKSGGRTYLKEQPLGELEALLDPGRFVRIHRTHVVNLDHVAAFRRERGGHLTAELRDGTRLAVSRQRARELRGLAL